MRPKDRDRILTDKRKEPISVQARYDLYATRWDSEKLADALIIRSQSRHTRDNWRNEFT